MRPVEYKKINKDKRELNIERINRPAYLSKYGPRVTTNTLEDVTQENLKRILTTNGYNLVSDCVITGHNVRGVIVGYRAPEYIAIDHITCYNKPRDCPVRLNFPINQARLLKALKQIGSPAGKEISSKFYYYDQNPFETDYQA